MPEGREFELKFAVAPGDAEKLFHHPALVAAAPRRAKTRLISTYFDTPDAYLRRHRVSLRLRRSEAGVTETLKHATSRVDRAEFEHEGGGEAPDVGWLKTTPVWPVLAGGDVEGRLEPQFSVDVQRVTLPLVYRGAAIEGALDEGSIKAKGLTSPVREFELELQDGAPADVLALARRLARDLALVPSLVSKAEHGQAVADLTWGQPAKVLDLDLAGTRTMAEAFGAITQACLALLLRNAALISETDDVEAVHKARVAMRRLRAILQLFAPALRAQRVARLERDLKWAWTHLSETRDADVMAAGIDPTKAETADLAAILDASRRRARARLVTALASARWRLLCLDLIGLSLDGVRRSRRDRRWRPFVRRRLARLHRRVARRARRLRRRPAEDLHALRKHAKTLRYDIDLVARDDKLGSKRARKLQDALEHLQESLGALQDRSALADRLRTIVDASAPPPGTSAESWARAAFAAGRLIERTPDARSDLSAARKAARRARRSRAFA